MSDIRLLTVREAAQYLAISPSTLYGWVWQRRIPFVKVGRAVRFDIVELNDFIDRSRTQARASSPGMRQKSHSCYNTRAAGKG